jgi:hypothetical protein
MAYQCPECGRSGSLHIIHSIVLPPDSRSDDIVLQIVNCNSCHFNGAAIYEESRRGGLDSESWEHRGYRLGNRDLAHLKALIAKCLSRKDKNCHCPAHQTLGKANESGRWQPPFDADWHNSFPMHIK